MYELIRSNFRADTDSRKNDIVYQLTHTILPENSSSEAMQSHIDTFQKLIAEAKAVGLPLDDFRIREDFFLSISSEDFQRHLRNRLNQNPGDRRNWAALRSIVSDEIDIKTRQESRRAALNATVKTLKTEGRETGGKGRNKGKGKKKSDKKENSRAGGIKCTWCGLKNHTEENCRKKAAGELSQAQLQQAVKEFKQKHM
ncbi:hypothetical protein AYX14_07092, partial [Cryptococcus neoformans]